MLRPFQLLWPLCLLIAGLSFASGQEAGIVTTLPRPADDAPIITPLVTPAQNIPPAAVLTQAPTAPPPQSPAEDGLSRDIEFGPRLLTSPAEVGLLFPAVYQNLNALVNVGGLYTTTAQLPSAPLHFTAAPIFNLRMTVRDLGEFGVRYRLLASQGDGVMVGLDPTGAAALRSRLDIHVVDLNYYAMQDAGIWWGLLFSHLDNETWHPPRWSVNWDVGTRLASVFFDSRAIGPSLDRHISNYYFGAGPRVGLTLTRLLGASNLAFYGRVDGSAVMGTIQQRFSELSFPGGIPAGFGNTTQRMGQGVPTLTAQIGLASAGPAARFGHWEIGYQFEQWWLIGDIGPSTGTLVLQGLFARWTLCY